jgi:hypothetical protein
VPVLVRHTVGNLDRERYDRVNEILQSQGVEGPPQALQVHVLFGEGDDMQVSEIWESEQAFDEWYPTLREALDEVGVSYGPPLLLPISELWGTALVAD